MAWRINTFTQFLLWITLFGITNCASNYGPRLDILPSQSVQRKPIGKPLVLTCQPNVENKDLIKDLRWRDSKNNWILPKQSGVQPVIYTEALNSEQLMLVITQLSDTMAGDYYCSASYATSELLENKVTVETYVAITWKDAPENQSPIVGNDYVVRCVVTANPPPTVDWLRNGDQIKSNDRFVIKHDGLLIKNVQESDDGTYTCRAAVIQTGELMERNIRLDVQVKPEITSLDVEYEAIEGQEFSVKCFGRGKPAPEFKWINQDQKDMSLADRFSVVGHNGQMSITRVEEYDRGVYTCVAKNSAGFTEKKMQLNVVVKPKIYELKNITLPINEEAMLTCKAKGRPPPAITFRRWGTTEEFRVGQQENDDRIILEQNIDEEMGESSGILLISKTLRADDGLYQCIARNKAPEAAFEVGHIAVEYPPNFDHMRDLPPVYSWEERPANLSCMAFGFPNATIEWRWNERLIREMQDKFLTIVEEGPRSDLIVQPANRRYYSAYKCIAVNKLGRAEHMMELREAHLPTPVAQSKPVQVTATTITFDIIGPPTELGMPIKAYTCQYKEERNLDWNNAYNRTWTPDTPYVIEGLRPSTMYTFRFAARNDVGLGQWSAVVHQGTPSRSVPEAAKILNKYTQEGEDENDIPIIASTYADRFELMWNRPADNGEPIDFYTIRYCPGSKINGVWNEVEKLCKERDYISYVHSNQVLKELEPDSYYRVELRAHNSIGYSLPTNIYLKTARGLDIAVGVADKSLNISSIAIVSIAVVGVLILLLLIDFCCCITCHMGIFAMLCRKPKRSPSDLDEEKFGSGSLIRELGPSSSLLKETSDRYTSLSRPPSPSPLPEPILKIDDDVDDHERQPLSSNGLKKSSIVTQDGSVRLEGDIIGKNSAV